MPKTAADGVHNINIMCEPELYAMMEKLAQHLSPYNARFAKVGIIKTLIREKFEAEELTLEEGDVVETAPKPRKKKKASDATA